MRLIRIPASWQHSPSFLVPDYVSIEREIDLAGCLAGHKAAWDAFVAATAGIVHGAVRRAIMARGGSLGEAEDRVQDVYVRLLQRDAKLLRDYDPTRASLATWLTIIARTVVHEVAKRKHLPLMRADDGSEISRLPGPAITPPLLPDLPWAVLSDQQRLVLHHLFEQGCTVEETAHRLDIAEQTVRSTKHKALERLRAALRPDSGDVAAAAHLPLREGTHATAQADIR